MIFDVVFVILRAIGAWLLVQKKLKGLVSVSAREISCLALLALILTLSMTPGCISTSGGGGGGGYYPSSYSVSVYNPYYFTVGWVLTPPGSWTCLRSGNLRSQRTLTLSGLTGSYDLDFYTGGLDGAYAGSARINGGGSYSLENAEGKTILVEVEAIKQTKVNVPQFDI